MLRANLKPGLREMKNSLSKGGYLEEVRKYCPGLTRDDLRPYPAGVRAQAIGRDGKMIDDFLRDGTTYFPASGLSTYPAANQANEPAVVVA